MNRLWFLRSVLALSVTIMTMSNTGYTALSDTGNVLIGNSLQNQKDLIVHCKSAHNDLGYHRVHPTGSYNLLYKLHYDLDSLENDHIWCHVWQGHGFKHHQVFNVYNGDHWEARDDGIYREEDRFYREEGGIYHHGIYLQWKMMYGWDATISKASSFGSSCVSVGLLLASSLFF